MPRLVLVWYVWNTQGRLLVGHRGCGRYAKGQRLLHNKVKEMNGKLLLRSQRIAKNCLANLSDLEDVG